MHVKFSFRIYTPLEAILLFLVSCDVVFQLLRFLEPYLHTRTWHPEVVKYSFGVTVLIIMIAIYRFITTHLDVYMDEEGLTFRTASSVFGFYRFNTFIAWKDLQEWSFSRGQLSGKLLQLDSLTIKYGDKTKRFYMADGNKNSVYIDYFLKSLKHQSDERAIKNTPQTVFEFKSEKSKKGFAVIAVLIWLSVPFLMLWYWFYREPIVEKDKIGNAIALVLMFILGLGLSYLVIRHNFLKKNKP